MKFKKTQMAVAVASLAGVMISSNAYAQVAASPERVVVTGSNIRQIEGETATPVQIIRREEIQSLGVSTVRELLDTITASTGGLSDISGSNSFASGASSASLRNLGKMSTLVLLNSRRVAPYALADYNEVFTNLDSLPFDAVERVEILRSGGSAVYGSDAVAGVINIITRSDYRGLQALVSRDQSLENGIFNSTKVSITGGFGNLATDGYNVLANLEVYQRNDVTWRDVLDDINPYYAVRFATVRVGSGLMFGNRGTPSSFSHPGNLIGIGPVPGCTTLNAAGLCVHDRFSRFQVEPSADRTNALVSGKVRISDSLEGFAEVLHSTTKNTYTSAFPTYGSTNPDVVWGSPLTGQGKTFTYRFLPTTHPLNTSGNEVELRYRFTDAGGQTKAESTQYRALAGVRGTWNKYDWESAIGMMGGTAGFHGRNAISDSGFKQVIGNYDPTQTDPLFFNRDYKLGQVNTPAVLNLLFPEQGYDAKLTQTFFDTKLNGEMASFNGRPVNIAAGFDVRHEKLRISPTANLLAGDIVGNGAANADASRTNQSVFAEVSFPAMQNLELQAAARIDKFPGFSAHTSPKLAFRYEAMKQLVLRGSAESGFRAPNLTESAQSSKFAFDNGVTDPKRCDQAQALATNLRDTAAALPANDPNAAILAARADIVENAECSTGIASIVKNNANLKPEVSRTLSLGFVLAPTDGFTVAVDYWKIERKDEIGLKSTDDLLAQEDSQAPGIINRQTLAEDKTFTAAERATYGVLVGPLASTSGQFLNELKTKTSGYDVQAAGRVMTGIGQVDLSLNVTFLRDLYFYSTELGAYGDNLAGRYGAPKTVANVSANLKTGNFTNGLRYVYESAQLLQGDYFDTSYKPAGCAARGWAVDDCRVAAYGRVDYNVKYTGFKNLTLSAYVRNVFDRRPPFDLKGFNRDGGGVIPQDSDDVKGRGLRLAVEYKFY